MVPNRIKFFLAGPVLEAANPRIPGRPHQRLAKMVGGDDRRVLEICAGTGYLARLVARAHPGVEIDALDLSPEMLAVGRRRAKAEGLARVTFVVGDVCALPFPDDHFDAVLASYGLHELSTAVRTGAIDEAARVLRPGGRLLVVDIDAPARRSRFSMPTCARWRSPTPARYWGVDWSVSSLGRASPSPITARHRRAQFPIS